MNQNPCHRVIFRGISSVLFTILLLGVIGCPTKTSVKKLTNVASNNSSLESPTNRKRQTDRLEGVVYRLPRTVLQITVPVKKVTKQPGNFSDFAPCFFSKKESDNRTKEKTVKFSIETPSFASRGEPDPDHTYVVNTKGGYFQAKTIFMEYTSTGLLTKGEAETTDNSLDFTIKAIGTVAGLGMNIARSASGVGPRTLNVGRVNGFERTVTVPKLNCALEGFRTHLEIDKKELAALSPIKADYDAITLAGAAGPEDQRLREIKALDESISLLKKKIEYLKIHPDFGETDTLNEGIDEFESEFELVEEKIKHLTEKKKTLLPKKRDAIQTQLDEAVKNRSDIQKEIKTRTDLISIGEEVEEDYKRALAIFVKLEALQAQRDQLISTAENVPPETFKAMVEKTMEAISTYRNAFLGESEEKVWTGTVEFTPDVTNNRLAFSYATNAGICTDRSLIQEQKIRVTPAFLNGNPAQNSCIKHLFITIDPGDTNQGDPRFIKQVSLAENVRDTSGWYYRIPPRGIVTLDQYVPDRDKREEWLLESTLGRSEMLIAQLGAVASVPAKTAGKTSSSSIVLDEASGALKNFKVSSTPLIDENTLKEAQTAVQTVVDATDPVTRKKRELELLQLQNQINEARKKLDETNTPKP